MKKAVIIIEDNFKEFQRIKSIIDGRFECRQQYTEDIDFNTGVEGSFVNNLKNSLKVTCETPDEYREQENIRGRLQDELESYCMEDEDPVYLIDYLLDGGSRENDINGINFKEKILEKIYPDKIIPVLFITSANHTAKIRVEDHVKEINDKSICDSQTKPSRNDWHMIKENVIGFIINAKSRPRKEQETDPNSHLILTIINSILSNSYSSIRSIKVETIETLNQNMNNLKGRPDLFNNRELTNLLDSFKPPYDEGKIKTFNKNILNILNSQQHGK